jgi:hypothetical protein
MLSIEQSAAALIRYRRLMRLIAAMQALLTELVAKQVFLGERRRQCSCLLRSHRNL